MLALRSTRSEPAHQNDANDQLPPDLAESGFAIALGSRLVQSLLLEALARETPGNAAAAADALAGALDVAERELHSLLAGIETPDPPAKPSRCARR